MISQISLEIFAILKHKDYASLITHLQPLLTLSLKR